MTIQLFFNHKDMSHDFLYSYNTGEVGLIPAVGDIVEFEGDDYGNADDMGTIFKVISKTVNYLGCDDESEIVIDVESYTLKEG